MTAFAHVEYPTEHPGVVRAENAAAALKSAAAHFDGARGAASLLSAWMVLWLVAFAALALLTSPARRAGVALRGTALAWAESRRRAAEDQRTWQVALKDPRIMAELNHAMGIPTVNSIRKYY